MICGFIGFLLRGHKSPSQRWRRLRRQTRAIAHNAIANAVTRSFARALASATSEPNEMQIMYTHNRIVRVVVRFASASEFEFEFDFPCSLLDSARRCPVGQMIAIEISLRAK